MQSGTWLGFSISRGGPVPVFEQICAAFRDRIVSGDLGEEERLPTTRTLATELGVSRSTIVSAYDQLVAEGYIRGVPGSGYRVCRIGAVELSKSTGGRKHTVTRQTVVPTFRPFHAGLPDMRLFPHRQWARAVSRVSRTEPEALVVSNDQFGAARLREAVADHVREWRGIEADPEQIMITAGSGDALEICIRLLCGPGDTIGLEDPGYAPVWSFATGLGLEVADLAIGERGARLPATNVRRQLKMVVLTPSHQFPLGGAMTPERRLEFINWAEQQNAWIVEDDYDSEFRYAGRPIPAMAGFDRLNRTIYLGSFSKIFSNSLRLGYLILPEGLVGQFRSGIGGLGMKASLMPQVPLAEFINNGEFYRHLRRVRRTYGERRRHLLDLLFNELGAYGNFTDHQAGMQVAFHLSDGLSDRTIAAAASEQGLTVQALSGFARNRKGLNGLLLGYCGFTETELEDGISVLKGVME